MIRLLRQRHLRITAVLGVLLPVGFAVGVAARKPVPVMASLPAEWVASPQTFAVTEWDRADLFTKAPLQVRLLREGAGAGRFAVQLSATNELAKPDVIVYWVGGSSNKTDALPDNARLLGAFSSSAAFLLPSDAGPDTGVLVLYSLADHEIVEVSKPFSLPKP